jgi:tetratricopeptide (TPR) repeat protein
MFLQRAHELKDKGAQHFAKTEYVQALACYAQALRVAPEGHPDRAMFHTNRAACYYFTQSFNESIHECNQALTVAPGFSTHSPHPPFAKRDCPHSTVGCRPLGSAFCQHTLVLGRAPAVSRDVTSCRDAAPLSLRPCAR